MAEPSAIPAQRFGAEFITAEDGSVGAGAAAGVERVVSFAISEGGAVDTAGASISTTAWRGFDEAAFKLGSPEFVEVLQRCAKVTSVIVWVSELALRGCSSELFDCFHCKRWAQIVGNGGEQFECELVIVLTIGGRAASVETVEIAREKGNRVKSDSDAQLDRCVLPFLVVGEELEVCDLPGTLLL